MKCLHRHLLGGMVAVLLSTAALADDRTDFFRAVKLDNTNRVAAMLNAGFDPNTRDEKGQVALGVALNEPAPKVAQMLMGYSRTQVDAPNAQGETPLMLAAIKGQVAAVQALVQRKADINKTGWTPLHYAASGTGAEQPAIIDILLDNYAYIDAESPNGTTPLMMAARYGTTDSLKRLLDAGADPALKNQQQLTAIDFARMAERKDAAELIQAALQSKQPRGTW